MLTQAPKVSGVISVWAVVLLRIMGNYSFTYFGGLDMHYVQDWLQESLDTRRSYSVGIL